MFKLDVSSVQPIQLEFARAQEAEEDEFQHRGGPPAMPTQCGAVIVATKAAHKASSQRLTGSKSSVFAFWVPLFGFSVGGTQNGG